MKKTGGANGIQWKEQNWSFNSGMKQKDVEQGCAEAVDGIANAPEQGEATEFYVH